MTGRKLSEVELEALAHGRRDLVPEELARAVEQDEGLAATVAREREASIETGVALRRAVPEIDDLDAMIARAMQHAPADEPRVVAPSRASLWSGAAVGIAIALASGIASVIASRGPAGLVNELWTDATSLARLGVALGLMLDRYVQMLPGGWAAVAMLGLALLALLSLPLRAMTGPWQLGGPRTTAAALVLAVLGAATTAHAYDVEGAWPEPDPRVSVDAERAPLSEALRQALASADLGLAYSLPEDPPVTLHVRGAPLREVLDALLAETPARVRHSGHLVVVRPVATSEGVTTVAIPSPTSAEAIGSGTDAAGAAAAETETAAGAPTAAPDAIREAAAPVAPTTAAPSTVAPAPALPAPALPAPALPVPGAPPTRELRDLVTFGGDARVLPDQQVRDVITMGGNARIEGLVYGNVVTMGGNAEVHGTVVGDVITMGGNVRVRPGGHVHGQLNAMGGRITIDEPESGAASGAQVATGAETSAASAPRQESRDDGWLGEALESAMRYALLFLLGLLFMGLSPERLRTLQQAIVLLPLRSMATGFLGTIAAAVLTLVLVITILGIPAAVVLGLGLFFAAYLGLAATASVIGAALPIGVLKERPVLQLAVGVLALFVASRVPVVGGLVVIGAMLAGLGAVLLTRLGQKQPTG